MSPYAPSEFFEEVQDIDESIRDSEGDGPDVFPGYSLDDFLSGEDDEIVFIRYNDDFC